MNLQITDLFPSGVDLLPATNEDTDIAKTVAEHAARLVEMRQQHTAYLSGSSKPYDVFSENLVLPYLKGMVGKMSFEHERTLVITYLTIPPLSLVGGAQPIPYSKVGEVRPLYLGNYIVPTVTGFIACTEVNEEGLNSSTMFSIFPIINEVYVNTSMSILTTNLPLTEVILNSEMVLNKLKLAGAGRYTGNPLISPYASSIAMSPNPATMQPQSTPEISPEYWTTKQGVSSEPMLRPYPLNIHPIAPEPVLGQFTPLGVDEEEYDDEDYDGLDDVGDVAEMYQAADVSKGIPADVYYMNRHLRPIPDTDPLKATALSLLAASAINPLREFNIDLDYVTKLRTSIGMYGLIERGLSNLVVVIIRGSALAPVIQFIDFNPNTYHISANVSYAYNFALNKQCNTSHIWTLDKTLADYKIPHPRLITQIFNLKGAN